MALLKKCLLVTDDPDDHVAFTDAVSEITANAVVLAILDSQKALSLLIEKTLLPDYIFLDLSMHAVNADFFLNSLREDEALSKIPTVLYGDRKAYDAADPHLNMTFFSKDYTYSDIKDFVQQLIRDTSGV